MKTIRDQLIIYVRYSVDRAVTNTPLKYLKEVYYESLDNESYVSDGIIHFMDTTKFYINYYR